MKEILQKNNYLFKIDLKDAYFAVHLHPSYHKYICLIMVICKLNVRLIIFLDDILIMASAKKEGIQARVNVIFFLQTLAFLINKNESVLHPRQIYGF